MRRWLFTPRGALIYFVVAYALALGACAVNQYGVAVPFESVDHGCEKDPQSCK